MTSNLATSVNPKIARKRRQLLLLTVALVAIAGSGCSKEQDTKEEHLSRGNSYFAAQQYDKAEKEYRDLLRLAPDDPVAIRQLGIIYQDQGQIAAGVSAAQEIRRTKGGRP